MDTIETIYYAVLAVIIGLIYVPIIFILGWIDALQQKYGLGRWKR